MNPFAGQADPTVIAAAQQGDRDALTEIIDRHRPWVYNIALRMLGDPGSADDATQDIFIKVLRRIGSFQGRSAFRTWLYRVAFHHLLNVKRSPGESHVSSFEEYGANLQAAPDQEMDDIPLPERTLLVEEAKVLCMSGMLMCLNREQRLAYVLGTLFDLPDTLAAEILEIKPATFRKRLQRARADLHGFMNNQCGLINKDNPCRCARKTKTFMNYGFLDRDNLTFHRDRVATIGQVASRDAGVVFDKVTGDYPALYREHPFLDPDQLKERLGKLLDDTALDGLLPS
jgi:RNA polymerase sigma factor (sigma-70 family)